MLGGYICVFTCLHHNSSTDRKCYLSNVREMQEATAAACLEFHRFLTPVMRPGDRRTMSGTEFPPKKDANGQTGVTQKVSYVTVGRKDSRVRYGGISETLGVITEQKLGQTPCWPPSLLHLPLTSSVCSTAPSLGLMLPQE